MQFNIKELTEFTPIKSRFGDPLIGSFAISFFVYNWKILLYLFSKKDAILKIELIETLIHPNYFFDFSLAGLLIFIKHPFVAPLLFTISYLFLLPKYARPLYRSILNFKVQSANDRFTAELNLSPTEKRIQTLEAQNAKERERINELNNLLSSKEENIRLLNQESQHLKKEILRLEEQSRNFISPLDAKVTDTQNQLAEKSLIHKYLELASLIATSSLSVHSDSSRSRKNELAIFFSMDLLQRQGDTWFLTDLGKAVMKQIQRI